MRAEHGYFEVGGKSLYATLYMPSNRPANGVVLCEPFGEEKRCTARMMTRLACRLAEEGHAVLRFDYSGTGDSAGLHSQARWSEWEEETAAAGNFLMSESGCASLSFSGFRAGCLLAAAAAVSVKESTSLILTEPFLSGADLLQELERREQLKRLPVLDEGDGMAEYGGFPVSAEMREEMKERTLSEMISRLPDALSLHLLRVSGMKTFPASWKMLTERATLKGHAEIIRDKPFWGQVEYFESDSVIDAVAACIGR